MTIVLDRETGKFYTLHFYEDLDLEDGILVVSPREITYEEAQARCRNGNTIKIGDLLTIMHEENIMRRESSSYKSVEVSIRPRTKYVDEPSECELCGRRQRYCICGGFWYCPDCDLGVDIEYSESE